MTIKPIQWFCLKQLNPPADRCVLKMYWFVSAISYDSRSSWGFWIFSAGGTSFPAWPPQYYWWSAPPHPGCFFHHGCGENPCISWPLLNNLPDTHISSHVLQSSRFSVVGIWMILCDFQGFFGGFFFDMHLVSDVFQIFVIMMLS